MAPARLKVFQASLGFHETVVAAFSQAAALRAWGVRQNLFAEKLAALATDPAAIQAALADPGEPLSRPAGSSAPFAREPKGVPHVPPSRKRAAGVKTTEALKRPPPPAKPAQDRRPLDRAEAALRALDEARAREEDEFRQRRKALDGQEAAARVRYAAARAKAEGTLARAKAAFERAGGETDAEPGDRR